MMETTIWQRWPPGTFLYSTWMQKNFWEICVFHWVMDNLKLHFSYLYNGNWNFQIAITDLILLWDPINWLKIWMFYTFLTNSVQTPRYILVLYLAANEFLRNMCFPLSNGHLKLHFSYLYNGNWNLQWLYNCLILLWELGRHYVQPSIWQSTFLYSTWMQKNFGEICVLHWVMDIWNCIFPISTKGIEIFKWL